MGIEAFQILFGGTVLVVIALDARQVHLADLIQAFLGIGVVPDDIAQTGVVGAPIRFRILQYGLEGFPIPVDVGDNRVLHSL